MAERLQRKERHVDGHGKPCALRGLPEGREQALQGADAFVTVLQEAHAREGRPAGMPAANGGVHGRRNLLQHCDNPLDLRRCAEAQQGLVRAHPCACSPGKNQGAERWRRRLAVAHRRPNFFLMSSSSCWPMRWTLPSLAALRMAFALNSATSSLS